MFKNWSVGRPVKFAEGMPAVFWGGVGCICPFKPLVAYDFSCLLFVRCLTAEVSMKVWVPSYLRFKALIFPDVMHLHNQDTRQGPHGFKKTTGP